VFVGGLLVNTGGGWEVDQEAASLIGSGFASAIAGLPDGGAAMIVHGEGGQRLYERQSSDAPWAAAPTPLPTAPAGGVALFREAAQWRASVTAGSVGVAGSNQAQPSPGFPPNLGAATSVAGGVESGGILRQTGSGWRDETHELNPSGSPGGGYIYTDQPYHP